MCPLKIGWLIDLPKGNLFGVKGPNKGKKLKQLASYWMYSYEMVVFFKMVLKVFLISTYNIAQ
jgi:hypothetical protein